MNNNTLLGMIFATVLLVGGYLVYEANQDSPAEQMAEGFNEMTEEVGDEIDDATTN